MNNDYYMTRPEELEKFRQLRLAKGYPDDGTTLMDTINVLAGEDDAVFNAMWSFYNFAHAFDDLLDESGWDAEHIEAAMTTLHDAVTHVLMREGPGGNVRALIQVLARNWPESRRVAAQKAADDFFQDLNSNPFIRRHRQEFRCIFVQAMARCLDGEAMAHSDIPERVALAPAVRCGDVDALLHMVYLARGWAALRECGKFREYDLPDTVADQRKEVG